MFVLCTLLFGQTCICDKYTFVVQYYDHCNDRIDPIKSCDNISSKDLKSTHDKLTKLQIKHSSIIDSNTKLLNEKNDIEAELEEYKAKCSKLSRTISELRVSSTSKQKAKSVEIKALKLSNLEVYKSLGQ